MEPNDHENELKLIIDRPDADGELQVFLEPSATVLELKQAIETMDHHLQVGLQRLVWNGRQLADREVLQNVFRNTTDVPNLKLLLRKYAYSPTPMKRAHSAPTPTPSHQPSAPPEAPAAPPTPIVEPMKKTAPVATSARAQMHNYLMNKAYWNAAAEYGAIMTHATQLGYEVPFGESLFASKPTQEQHPAAPAPQPAPGAPREMNLNPNFGDPQNPEDAEIARQIAAAEAAAARPAFERHAKLLFKLAFFVLMLSQDASSERLMMLISAAMAIFLFQTGAFAYLLNVTGMSRATEGMMLLLTGQQQVAGRGGAWFEIKLFVTNFIATLFPGVHPAPVVFEPAEPDDTRQEEPREDGAPGEQQQDGALEDEAELDDQNTSKNDTTTHDDETDAIDNIDNQESDEDE